MHYIDGKGHTLSCLQYTVHKMHFVATLLANKALP